VAAFKAEGFKGAETWLCTSKIRRTKPCYGPAFEFLKTLVPADEVKYIKVTMVSHRDNSSDHQCAPEWFHLRHGHYAFTKGAYPSEEGYFADIAKAYREEIADLYKRGCRNIQIDDPLLAYFCAVPMIEGMKKVGINSEDVLDTYIKLYNDCLEGHPADMVCGLHLCRGNFKGGVHFSEGGYDAIAVKLFNEIHCDTYYLECAFHPKISGLMVDDTPRAGNFEPLASLPKNKTVVLGLISSKLPELEETKQVEGRLNEAAKILGDPHKKRICLSPQCGFASHIEGNKVLTPSHFLDRLFPPNAPSFASDC
jgi:methionine synthase II (cobalamin-independent)